MARKAGERTMVYALGHETRRQIVRAMYGKDRRTPTDIATEIKGELGNVSYHIQVLVECDVVELVDEKPKGGSISHLYELRISEGWVHAFLAQEDTGEAQ